jgi:hypothetical protein
MKKTLDLYEGFDPVKQQEHEKYLNRDYFTKAQRAVSQVTFINPLAFSIRLYTLPYFSFIEWFPNILGSFCYSIIPN